MARWKLPRGRWSWRPCLELQQMASSKTKVRLMLRWPVSCPNFWTRNEYDLTQPTRQIIDVSRPPKLALATAVSPPTWKAPHGHRPSGQPDRSARQAGGSRTRDPGRLLAALFWASACRAALSYFWFYIK